MFTSYAQNYEDVILNRIFSKIHSGFYIDVGANHPTQHSVTKAFYDKGWSGINIEPVKNFFELLSQDRDRDINLNVAIGNAEDEIKFFEIENTGLSTFDRNSAEQHAAEGGYKVKPYMVSVTTLAQICEEHVTQPIDFLKIDVEGWEENVISGHNWARYRPKIVIIEATVPGTPIRKDTPISPFMKANNYEHVYFDGMNDFFLADEEKHLRHFFESPPNVFDGFNTHYTVSLRTQMEKLRDVIRTKNIQLNKLQKKLHIQNIKNVELNKKMTILREENSKLSAQLTGL